MVEGRQLWRIPPPRMKPRETSNHVETRRHTRFLSSFLPSFYFVLSDSPLFFHPVILSLSLNSVPLCPFPHLFNLFSVQPADDARESCTTAWSTGRRDRQVAGRYIHDVDDDPESPASGRDRSATCAGVRRGAPVPSPIFSFFFPIRGLADDV